ncbi:kinase-like protein [Rhizophagus irregularis]|nr:kinase-like protein [Rhizophagus irregularis]
MNIDNNPFDPTPKLKSSPVPVLFIPFKMNEKKCKYCGIEYSKSSKTLLCSQKYQKYCKNCLFWYIQYITGNNAYLDVRINTNNSQCTKHKATRNNFNTTHIQEWCEYCSEILFTQVVTNNSSYNIPDSYQVSSGWVESTLNKKPISILYLPWWDGCNKCVVCFKELKYIHQESKSHCQKWCSYCFIIYTGCRHCLTTNIIFGIADQSQCKKCRRISFIRIEITDISSGNCIIDEFLASTGINNEKHHLIANYMIVIGSPYKVYSFIHDKLPIRGIGWIPYSQVTNLKKIAEGGFSIIYKATWEGTDVAVKKLRDSQNISKHFLNELRSLYQCNDYNFRIIGCHGITQDPITKEYMLILNYAEGGNLHDYLQKNFINLRWNDKLYILQGISFGLQAIHRNNFIHRDIHSGNMLLSQYNWKVGDLGLSQPANNTLLNNEIYGVIPYIAPEIFKGAAFSKESDVYSFGMIMWELTTGCKPFANIKHNVELIYKIIDGKRPEITNDTPECFANLMKNQLGPEFSENPHPKAIFTSRALSSLISKASTINSSSMISFNVKQEYITREYEIDTNNNQSSSTQNTNSATQSLTVPINSSRKRNFERLENESNETQKNRKYIKVDNLEDEYC